jgi:hypothetical protein
MIDKVIYFPTDKYSKTAAHTEHAINKVSQLFVQLILMGQKRTGIVRELDELGLVKIRYELCKTFGIEDNTTHLELLVMGGFVQVKEKLHDQTFLFSKKN